ncbi:hypothetical protein B0H13DRAFT_10280 [Mycena leptocephala]|nr:hypothetical protein B0H13DRAFT_10280 [Mycena leptocephala]
MQNKKSNRKAGSFAQFLNFSPLHDAHTQLWNTLLPLQPFRALTPADIANADPAFTAWETASDSITILAYDNAGNNRPNTNLLLVDAMLRFCEYGAGIPDISGTDGTEVLRQRFVRLKRHIEKALLAEARSDERLVRQDRSDAQSDLDLVRDWAIEIQEELLNPGQRTEHWTHDALPWILVYLTTWDDIEFSILSDSGITLVMRDIIYAPIIPVVSYMQPIRAWAASLLNRWKSRPEVVTLPPGEKTRLGLDINLLPTHRRLQRILTLHLKFFTASERLQAISRSCEMHFQIRLGPTIPESSARWTNWRLGKPKLNRSPLNVFGTHSRDRRLLRAATL